MSLVCEVCCCLLLCAVKMSDPETHITLWCVNASTRKKTQWSVADLWFFDVDKVLYFFLAEQHEVMVWRIGAGTCCRFIPLSVVSNT